MIDRRESIFLHNILQPLSNVAMFLLQNSKGIDFEVLVGTPLLARFLEAWLGISCRGCVVGLSKRYRVLLVAYSNRAADSQE